MSHPTLEQYDPWRDVPEPPRVGDGYDGNQIIVRAVKSIYVFAPDGEYEITREQAAAILKWWQHFHELTEREITAILARFPDPLLDDAGNPLMTMYERWEADEAWWARHPSIVDEAPSAWLARAERTGRRWPRHGEWRPPRQ
jgi:hypothetical protein